MSSVGSIDSSRANTAVQILQQAAANHGNQQAQRASSADQAEEASESQIERASEIESSEGRSLNITA